MSSNYAAGSEDDVRSRFEARTPPTSGGYNTPGAYSNDPFYGDKATPPNHTASMSNSISQMELDARLLDIEARMDRRAERMERETDRRADEFRRELELRDIAFQREQALRDQAMSERFSGFLAAQVERDKRMDESLSSSRRELDRIGGDISRLGSLKLNIWGAMITAVGIVVAIGALTATSYQTGKGDRAADPSPPATTQAPQRAELPTPSPAPAPASSPPAAK